MTTLADVISRIEAIEKATVSAITGSGLVTSSATAAKITAGQAVLTGSITTAEDVNTAVSTQTSLLNKVEDGISAFLNDAPGLVSVVDPAVAGPATAVATLISGLVSILKSYHTQVVSPNATATVTASAPAIAPAAKTINNEPPKPT